MMWGVLLLCAKLDGIFGGGETEFYGVWDKGGSILGRLFSVKIRDESQTRRMTELVTHYPYISKGEEEDPALRRVHMMHCS